MINVDGSVFIQIVNFIILIWVLNIILYKPIRNVLAQRKEKITGLEQSIETFNYDSKEKEDAFDAGIKEARAKGLKDKEALVEEASQEEKSIVEKINEKAQADLVRIRSKIAKDTESVRVSLQQEVDFFADAIVKKILGRAV
ncbi:MAG: ATP synthase F0 subunit B [Deltaproteobacteria bacterium]|nr:ATP synthase F0 subunit B [Deltaproteobacteria bacterium]MBW2010815.1 ATP synthase F0 subunit B [Deltaproteobacteria bacterium]MBW2099525.1 ATP synthase F0 subunit B [Deltaproteobacteria bacterium]